MEASHKTHRPQIKVGKMRKRRIAIVVLVVGELAHSHLLNHMQSVEADLTGAFPLWQHAPLACGCKYAYACMCAYVRANMFVW